MSTAEERMQNEIDELEQENRLLRARNDRLEAELKAVPVLSAGPITSEMANWSAEDKAELVAAIAKHTVPVQEPPVYGPPIGILMKMEGDETRKLYPLKQKPAPTVQEPVAIALNTGTKQGVKWLKNVEHGESLYTTPPAQPAHVQEPDAFDCGVYLGKGKDHAIKHHVSYQPAPVQEPVVRWDSDGWGDLLVDNLPDGTLLYTTPPAAQRQWVGLTDEQKLSLEIQGGKSDVMLAELVESWLKEKNT